MDLSVGAAADPATKRTRSDDCHNSASNIHPQNPAILPSHTGDPLKTAEQIAADRENIPEFNGAPQNNALDLTSHHVMETNQLESIIAPSTSNSINGESHVSLSQITFKKVLHEDPRSKRFAFQGEYKGSDAVVVLERTAFSEESVKSIMYQGITPTASGGDINNGTNNTSSSSSNVMDYELSRDFVNDIYGKYDLRPNPTLNQIKTTIIHPASVKHIEKYSSQDVRLIKETSQDYLQITLPFISSRQLLDLQWVHNILEHKSESERIVFEDAHSNNGFILLPDLKWDQKTLSNLYLVAIVHKKGIKSIRDLTIDHIPLLQNILVRGTEAIVNKYLIHPDQLRIYLHYQPSYYHLHVHFTSVSYEAPGARVERAHLLETVISNLLMVPDYYQRATLSFPIASSDPLYNEFHKKKDEAQVQEMNQP